MRISKLRLRKFVLLGVAAAATSTSSALQAQMVFSGAGPNFTVSENFNTTTTTTLPSGWRVDVRPAAASPTFAGASTTANVVATSFNGSSTGQSYVVNSSGDYAVALLNSGTWTNGKSIFAQLSNGTGADITSLDLSWNYEKYRSGSRAWQYDFSVSTDGSSWSDIDSGDQAYAADGANTTTFFPPQSIAKAVNLTGITIANGASYFLRWTLNAGGASNGQAIGIDDFVAVAHGGVVVTNDLNLSVSPDTLTFGTNNRIIVGTDVAAQTVTVSEAVGGTTTGAASYQVVNSDAKITVGGIAGTVGGPYFSGSVPNAGSTTFDVDINTATTGAFGIKLVASNLSNVQDSDNQSVEVAHLTGGTPEILGAVVDNRVLTVTPAAFGRVIVNNSATAIGGISTSGGDSLFTRLQVAQTNSPDVNGVQVTSGFDSDGSDNGATGQYDSTTDVGTRTLSATFTTTGAKTGSASLAVTGEGLVGEVDPTVAFNYTATAVDNRTLSIAPSTVGTVRTITGAAITGSATVSGGSQTDDQGTRVILGAGSASSGSPPTDGLTVTSAAAHTFNGAGQTAPVTYNATFGSAGLAQSKSVDLVPGLVSSGETVASNNLQTGSVAVISYNADAPDAFAILTLKDLSAGQTLFFTDNGWVNQTGGFRSGEGVRQLAIIAPIPAGTVLSSAGSYGNATFSNVTGSLDFNNTGDQLLVFTASDPQSPLTTATQIYSFDTTNGYEDGTTAPLTTGQSDLPPGLVLNDTATTFDVLGTRAGVFNLSSLSSGTGADWRTAIANPSNWTFATGQTVPSTGSVTVTDGSAGTFGLLTGQTLGSTTLTVNADVLDHSNASFAASDTNALTINFGSVAQGSSASQTFSLLNLLSGANPTANLDLLSITPAGGNSAALSTNLAAFANLAAGGSNGYTATLNTAAAGSFSADYTLNLADEAGIIGGTAQTLTLHLQGTVTPATGGNQYALAGSGPYNQTTSWTQGTIPNSSTAVANFLGSITAPSTVTVSTPVTVNAVNFNNANGYTVAGSTITLAGTATVSVLSGDQTISAPLSVPTAVTFSTAGASTLTTGAVTGAGTATVASNSHVTSSYVRTSSLTVSGSAGNDSALLTIPQTAPLSPFPQGDPAHVSVVNTLNVAHLGGTYYGTIDVGNNDIIVKDGTQATYDDVAAALTSGANIANGFWDGKGIASSLAADFNNADTYGKFGVGYLFNDSDLDPSTIDNPAFGEVPVYDSFDGIALVGRETLIKFTYFGDSNLNGIIDDSDYGAIDSGRYGFGTGWLYGDFDYDGAVTDNDYSLLDAGRAAYDTFSALPAYAPVATVPEPGSIALLVMGGLGLAAAGFRKRQLRLKSNA